MFGNVKRGKQISNIEIISLIYLATISNSGHRKKITLFEAKPSL